MRNNGIAIYIERVYNKFRECRVYLVVRDEIGDRKGDYSQKTIDEEHEKI